MNAFANTRQVTHTPSGETALARGGGKEFGYVLLQFDRIDHPHSHGWYPYPSEDVVDVVEDDSILSLYPGACDGDK